MAKRSYFARNGFKVVLTVIILAVMIFGIFVGSEIFLRKKLPMEYSEFVEKYSAEYGLDKYLVYSIISTESDFVKDAKSSAGACGLMQLMPETAQWINSKYSLSVDPENLFDPETNIKLGCCYYAYLVKKFESTENAICAYNGGEGNIEKWLNNEEYSSDGITLQVIPFKETKNYLKKVTTRYEIYKDLYSK